MTFSDNSNALLLKRKMARKSHSQNASCPSILSTSQDHNLSKEKNVKSYSNCKRLYRSNDNTISEYVHFESRKKTLEEIEFEKKIYQLNCLQENSPNQNEFNHVNYSFDNEIYESDVKYFDQKNILKNNEYSLLNRERINENENVFTNRHPLIYNQSQNKLTNWNDEDLIESNIYQKERIDPEISKSILKSFNMYRF